MSDKAAPFAEMAASIKHNEGQGFGGGFVIVPPGEVEPLSVLLLDSSQDAAQFIGMIQARCAVLLASIEDENKLRLSPFGR